MSATASTGLVQVRRDGRVTRVSLNRPAKKNAITLGMYGVLADALAAADADTDCSVVLLDAIGDSFCAGNDIADFLSGSDDGLAAEPVRFLTTLAELNVPLVAAVHGVAVGIGTTMLLHCDLVYAASDTQFRLPFVDLALVPEAGSTYLLPALGGHQRAAELLLLGRPFGAEEAHQLGVVTEVLPAAAVGSAAEAAAATLAAKPPAALRATKRLLRAADRPRVRAAIEEELVAFGERVSSPEARELFQAFLSR